MGYGQFSDGHVGRTNPLAGQAKAKRQRQVFPTGEIPHFVGAQNPRERTESPRESLLSR